MYNKHLFKKSRCRKILHKIGKHWCVLSLAFFAMIGGGAIATHTSVSADATNNVQVENVAQVQNNQSAMTSQSSQSAQSAAPASSSMSSSSASSSSKATSQSSSAASESTSTAMSGFNYNSVYNDYAHIVYDYHIVSNEGNYSYVKQNTTAASAIQNDESITSADASMTLIDGLDGHLGINYNSLVDDADRATNAAYNTAYSASYSNVYQSNYKAAYTDYAAINNDKVVLNNYLNSYSIQENPYDSAAIANDFNIISSADNEISFNNLSTSNVNKYNQLAGLANSVANNANDAAYDANYYMNNAANAAISSEPLAIRTLNGGFIGADVYNFYGGEDSPAFDSNTNTVEQDLSFARSHNISLHQGLTKINHHYYWVHDNRDLTLGIYLLKHPVFHQSDLKLSDFASNSNELEATPPMPQPGFYLSNLDGIGLYFKGNKLITDQNEIDNLINGFINAGGSCSIVTAENTDYAGFNQYLAQFDVHQVYGDYSFWQENASPYYY